MLKTFIFIFWNSFSVFKVCLRAQNKEVALKFKIEFNFFRFLSKSLLSIDWYYPFSLLQILCELSAAMFHNIIILMLKPYIWEKKIISSRPPFQCDCRLASWLFSWVGVNCSKFYCSTKSRIGRFLSAVRVSIFNLT